MVGNSHELHLRKLFVHQTVDSDLGKGDETKNWIGFITSKI